MTEPQLGSWFVDQSAGQYSSSSSALANAASAPTISAPFFADMLTAFEIWLDFGGGATAPKSSSSVYKADGSSSRDASTASDQTSSFPVYLPIILQVSAPFLLSSLLSLPIYSCYMMLEIVRRQ